MAGGRKKHRHVGPEYGMDWVMGEGPQGEVEPQAPHPLEVEAEALIRKRREVRDSRAELVIVENDEEMDETFKDLDRRADQALALPGERVPAFSLSEPAPAPQELLETPTPTSLQSALDHWRQVHRDEYTYLLFLQQFEPDRYSRAIASITSGRGAAVARALPTWYTRYRDQHGWD